MKSHKKLVVLAAIFFICLDVQAQFITGWVDVAVNIHGRAEKVTLVSPKAAPEMAKPIEDAVKQWDFEPGKKDGRLVKRTTAVAVTISLINSGKESKVTATKLKEGPRILKKENVNCLKGLRKEELNRKVSLKYKVNPDGAVSDVNITKSSGTEEFEKCILSIIEKTIFKPEALGGSAVVSEIEREFRIKDGP
jgi:TonB family protein